MTNFRRASESGNIKWRRHALTRMMERGISRDDVKKCILHGEVIKSYPDDKPFPSALVFDLQRTRPIHVVASYDEQTETCYIVTVYEPDTKHFQTDFKTRKEKNE